MSTTTDQHPQSRPPGSKPSPRPRRAADPMTLDPAVLRIDAAAGPEDAPGTAPAQGEPRVSIEPARLAHRLTQAAAAGGGILTAASGALAVIPPHRWPHVVAALGWAVAAGMSLLVGAGMSWIAATNGGRHE